MQADPLAGAAEGRASAALLPELSALAARSYASAKELASAALQLAADQLGMRTSYLTRLLPEGRLEVIAAHVAPGGYAIAVGESYAVAGTYCHELVTAAQPASLVIGDTRADQRFKHDTAARAMAGVGSYVGVPLLAKGGRVFGTLCAVDPQAHTPAQQQVDLLVVLARLLMSQIERDRELVERRRAEAQLAQALAEQRQISARLEQISGAKGHFVSIVSHEFRTALTGIHGFSEMLRDVELSREEIRDYAADINKEAKRLNRLITEMLDLERMESGRLSLNPQPVDLNRLVASAVGTAQRNAAQHQFALKLDPALPTLTADRDKLTQVVANLLSNAVKYSPNGGTITVATQLGDAAVSLYVRDQGVGIAPGELGSVFERFRQAPTDATRYMPGTGLGLPIVRQIVELHGGQVWAESVLGQGSTFFVTLPIIARSSKA